MSRIMHKPIPFFARISSVMIACAICSVSAKALPEPIARWTFDEPGGTTVYDQSTNGYHGTLINADPDTARVPGIRQNAIQLDGIDDYIRIDNYNGIPGTQARTVTAWFKCDPQKQYQTIIQWGSGDYGQLWLIYISKDQSNSTHLNLAVYGSGASVQVPIDDGRWHHIAGVMEESIQYNAVLRIYLDGQLVTTGYGARADTLANIPVHIGCWYKASEDRYLHFFQGLMDDMRIYDTILTQEQIEQMEYDSLFHSGTGTKGDPYQITSPEQLIAMGSIPQLMDDHYILMNDIVFDPNNNPSHLFSKALIAPYNPGQPFPYIPNRPIMDFFPFTGTLDGNGKTLHNLRIMGTHYIGLFGQNQGIIKNLTLDNMNLRGLRYIGAVASDNLGLIQNCRADGKVQSLVDLEGQPSIGGLAGDSSGILFHCSADVDVTAMHRAAGLVGNNSGSIIQCSASGTIDGLIASGLVSNNIGGFISSSYSNANVVGINSSGLVWYNYNGTILNSSVTGLVSGPDSAYGLLYKNQGNSAEALVKHCYIAAPLIASNSAKVRPILQEDIGNTSVVKCVWDIDKTGITYGVGGVGLTTDQMYDPNTYLSRGWDFVHETQNGLNDPWLIPSGGGYPRHSFEYPQEATPAPFEGQGTAENPYQINSASDLLFIQGKGWLLDKHYQLQQHINLAAYTEDSPIIAPDWELYIEGYQGIPFMGCLDGRGYALSDFSLNNTEQDNIGLCGYICNSSITNLTLDNFQVKGRNHVGALCGYAQWPCIENCRIEGNIDGQSQIGGVAGTVRNGDIQNCQTDGFIYGIGQDIGGLVGLSFVTSFQQCNTSMWIHGRENIGGLVGRQRHGLVDRCASNGVISGNGTVGGLIGQCEPDYNSYPYYPRRAEWGHRITNSYSQAIVIAVHGGGLIGRIHQEYDIKVDACYAAGLVIGDVVGGFAGSILANLWDANPILSFWDMGTSGLTNGIWNPSYPVPDFLQGKSTFEMQTLDTFTAAGWDFEKTWTICERSGYPRLQWQVDPADRVCPEGVDLNDFAWLARRYLYREPTGAYPEYGYIHLDDVLQLSESWLHDIPEARHPQPDMHRWTFEEEHGPFVMDSANQYHGLMHNCIRGLGQHGINRGIYLNGINAYVQIPGFQGITGTHPRTVCAWIRSTGGPILSWGAREQYGQSWWFEINKLGHLSVSIYGALVFHPTRMDDNNWHHVAAVLGPKEVPTVKDIQLYIDGNPVLTLAIYPDTPIDTRAQDPVEFGRSPNGYFYAGLDDIRIYSRALSLEEIQSVMNE